MSTKQAPITMAHLDALELVCYLLEHQPYQSAQFRILPVPCTAAYQDLRRHIIFHSSRYGWRLHTDWREQLAAKRAALAPQATENAGG